MTFYMKVYCIVVFNLYILLSKLVYSVTFRIALSFCYVLHCRFELVYIAQQTFYSATFLQKLAATFILLHGAL